MLPLAVVWRPFWGLSCFDCSCRQHAVLNHFKWCGTPALLCHAEDCVQHNCGLRSCSVQIPPGSLLILISKACAIWQQGVCAVCAPLQLAKMPYCGTCYVSCATPGFGISDSGSASACICRMVATGTLPACSLPEATCTSSFHATVLLCSRSCMLLVLLCFLLSLHTCVL